VQNLAARFEMEQQNIKIWKQIWEPLWWIYVLTKCDTVRTTHSWKL